MSTSESTPDFTTTTDEGAEAKAQPGDRSTALRAAYGAATQRLREENRQRFDTLYEEEARARGVDYKRKPTEEEKAEAAMRDLLAKHPNLAEKVLSDKS